LEKGEIGLKKQNIVILIILGLLVCGAIWHSFYYKSTDSNKEVAPPPKKEETANKKNEPADNIVDVGIKIGQKAPDFKLKTLNGKTVELSQSKKLTIVNFWATWCPPCREEMPEFQKAYEKYKDQANFMMINVTSTESDPSAVPEFLRSNGFTFPVLLDDGTESPTLVADQYGVVAIPTTYIVDPAGKIVYKRSGMMKMQELEQWISKYKGQGVGEK
jgi:peroxiredoxin